MQLICSPFGIIDPKHPGQGIHDIQNVGFKKISLDPSHLKNLLSGLFSQCRKDALQIPLACAPYLPRDTKRTDLNMFLE